MKKIYLFAVIAVSVFLGLQLVGCQNQNGPDTKKYEHWPAQDANGKWGYINRKGVFDIQPIYDDAEVFTGGYAVVQLGGRLLFINEEGKIQNAPSFDYSVGFYNNYAVVSVSGKYGVLDKNFNYVLQPVYYDMGDYVAANKLVPCKITKEDKWGFLNVETGKMDIKPQYERYQIGFIGDYAVVSLNEMRTQMGVINSQGEYIIQPIYDDLYPLGSKVFSFRDNSGNKGILDEKGNILVPCIYDGIMYDGDLDRIIMSNPDWYPVENTNGKWGYIDKNGVEKIPFQYDEAYYFMEDYAYVEMNHVGLIINRKGDVKFTLKESERVCFYQHGFTNGLILTYDFKYYRYRDTDGNIVYLWEEK